MTEYCFETINWSPYVGFEKPDLAAMIRIAASVGYRWITLDQKGIAYYTEHDGSLETLRLSLTEKRLRETLASGYVFSRDVVAGDLNGELRVVVQDRDTGLAGSLRVPLRKSE